MLPIFHKRSYENGALKVRFQETGIPSAHKRPQGQGWAMDEEGYSYVTFTRPTNPNFYQGIAIKNGAMYVSTTTSDDDYWSNGLRIGRDGSLKVGVPSGNSDGIQVIGGKLSVAGLTFFAGFADLGSGEVDLTALASDDTATFTRATTATTVNSAGTIISVASGVPRSYYDPTTLAYMGYLAEGARTNLCLSSEDMRSAAAGNPVTGWINNDSTVTVAGTTAPDGSANGNLITEGTAGNAGVTQVNTGTADVTYSMSRWFKRGNTDWVSLHIFNGANVVRGWFNLATGAVGSVANGGTGSGAAVKILAFPNGWYRCTLSGSIGSGATAISHASFSSSADSSITRVNNATYYVWGAQFENNATFASSYIPTTTASVTRNADVLTYPFTGNADATQGTAYLEINSGPLSGSKPFLSINDGTINNRIAHFIDASVGHQFLYQNAGSVLANLQIGGAAAFTNYKRAASWKTNKFAQVVNGGTVPTDLDGTISVAAMTRIAIGFDDTSYAFGTLKNIGIYDTQFTDTQLVDMTA